MNTLGPIPKHKTFFVIISMGLCLYFFKSLEFLNFMGFVTVNVALERFSSKTLSFTKEIHICRSIKIMFLFSLGFVCF